MSERKLPYNKACELEDFADPELTAVLQDVYAHEAALYGPAFPAGTERRKHWEVAMSVRALRDFGVLRADAEILGVGAGMEITLFYLTRHVRRVVATDLYLAPGHWEREAHPLMVAAPDRLSPIPFLRERLTVQHMDCRWLRFPDASFDGIFSSGSIEHFGDFEDMSAAAYEMGRVLKPGGILTLSTELLLEGPPGSFGWPGVVLFAPEKLWRHLIEASGLEPVDEPALTVSERTLATARPLVDIVRGIEERREIFPHVVLTRDGQVFGSVHLTLRKTERFPSPDNAWARPSEELCDRVRRGEAEAERRLLGAALAAPPAPTAAPAAASSARLEELYRRWAAVRASVEGVLRRAAGFVRGTASSTQTLAKDLERNLFRELIYRQNETEAEVARLQASEADIRGALNAMWSLHAKYEAGSGEGEMANLRDRQEILRVRQTRLEGALADLREELAALCGAPSAPSLPLTPRDLAELLASLERDTPASERPGAVEISFQDIRAEDLLLTARRHFGGRLSSSGPSYRAPNDLWIHTDFTAQWNRPVLLENAAARLTPGGRFLLVTAPAAGEPPRHESLVLEEDREVSLAGGGPVRVLAWRKQAAPGAAV